VSLIQFLKNMSNSKHKLSRTKKWVLIGALVFFAFQLTLPAVVAPRQAQAFLGIPNLTVVMGDIPDKIWRAVSSALKKAGDVAFKNVLTQYLNNLAYNAATKIATGDWGQKPLFPTQPGELLKQAADVAAGDFLESVVMDLGNLGKCAGYSSDSCGRDSDCAEPVLFCPNEMVTKIPEGITAGGQIQTYCSESKKNYDQCMAAGCTVVQLSSESDIAGAGKDVPAEHFVALGYPQCTSTFSLCDSMKGELVSVRLHIMAQEALFGGPPPEITGKCPLSEIIDNFEEGVTDWAPNLTSREKSQFYLAEVSKSFNPKSTEVGAYLEIVTKARKEGFIAKEKTEFAQGLAGAFNAVTSPITGAIKTPAPLVFSSIDKVFGTSLEQKLVYLEVQDPELLRPK